MTQEAEVHKAIDTYIRENDKTPSNILAGYEAAMDMMMFAGAVSYEGGTSIMTPFGLLKIVFCPNCDTSEWSIQ